MNVVIKYIGKWALYPYPYGGAIINKAQRTDVIEYPEINLEQLTNEQRSDFIYKIQRIYNNYYDVLRVDSINLIEESEVN